MAEPLPVWHSHRAEQLRPFSDIRLIAADLDGTLISKEVGTVARIESLRRSLFHPRYRVSMTLATGRIYSGVASLLEHLRLPRQTPLVLYNGSVVAISGSGEPLLQRRIPSRSLEQVVDHCREHGAVCLAYFFTPNALMSRTAEVVHGWASSHPFVQEFNGVRVTWNPSPSGSGEPNAILIVADPTRPTADAHAVEKALATVSGISTTRSGDRYLEIRPAGSNKATALSVVAEFLKVPSHQILALGDSDNDAEMLSWAGIGVAIASASPRALAAASYYCHHGSARGAVEVLRLVREAKRYFAA